jgi:DNA-binding winged helix-turn-helix (wHTH) protein
MTPPSRCTEAVRTRDLEVIKIERQRTWSNGGSSLISAHVESPAHHPEGCADRRVFDMIAFDDMELDSALFELRRGGMKMPMEPQAFDVLVYLVTHRDRVVAKEELMDAVWGGRFVTEAAVTSRIKHARRAVGDDGHTQRVIQTVHGRGYRFIAEIANVVAA